MKTGLRLILTSIVVLAVVPVLAACNRPSAGPSYDRAAAEAEIRELESAWAHVAVSGNPAIIERIFAEDFLGVSPEGTQYTKQMFIDDTRKTPPGFLSNDVGDITIRFMGDVAIAQGSEIFTRKGGEKGQFVWTDVLVRRDGEWKIAAAQDVVARPVSAAAAGAADPQAGALTAGMGPGQPLAAAQPGPGAPLFTGADPSPEARKGIDATRSAYAAAWRKSNPAEIAGVYTDDAVVLYPNQPAIAGHEAIVQFFTGFFASFPQNQFELVSSEVVVNGEWAFDQGTYRWKGTPRAGGPPEEDHGKYLVILKRQADGTWKVARDMDNSNRPASQNTRGSGS